MSQARSPWRAARRPRRSRSGEAVPDLADEGFIEVSFAHLGGRRSPGAWSKRHAARLRLLGLHYHVYPPDVFERLCTQGVSKGITGGERRREEDGRKHESQQDQGGLRRAARDIPHRHPEGGPVASGQEDEDQGPRREDAGEDQRQLLGGYTEELSHRAPP